MRMVFALVVSLGLSMRVACADMTWRYQSTGGGVTVSGTLVTDGVPADLGSTNSFNLVLIETVILNGTDLTADVNWALGAGPPFNSAQNGGAIFWDTTTGVIDTTVAETIQGFNSTNLNGVILVPPASGDDTLVLFDPTITPHAEFEPASTTFTPVPEPNSFLLVALAFFLMSRRVHGGRNALARWFRLT